MDKENVAWVHNRIFLSHKNKSNSVICSTTNQLCIYNTLNKPNTEIDTISFYLHMNIKNAPCFRPTVAFRTSGTQ